MFDVVDGFLEQDGDVCVVECVDDPAAASLPDDEAEMAEQAKLVGDGRWLHADRFGEVVDRPRRVAELGENAHAAGRRERLHRLRNVARGSRVD